MNEPDRYDEKQFALILRRAAELQARDSHGVRATGLTRTEIENIAAEAGIEARYVAAALESVVQTSPGRFDALLPPGVVRAQRIVQGDPGTERIASMIDVVQAEMGRPGSAREVLGGVEWTGRDSFGPMHLIVRRRGEDARVEVAVDRRELGIMLGILLPLAGVIAGGVVGAGLSAPPLLSASVGLVAGSATAGVIWRRAMTRWQQRVERLVDRVTAIHSPR